MSKAANHIFKKLLQFKENDLAKYNVAFLHNSIQKRIDETQCRSIEDYSALLDQNSSELELFHDSLHNNYSEFFRNPLTFSVLESIILPSLIHNKKIIKSKELRIWSAACSAGQEAYSLAILLEEIKSGGKDNFSYRIFASDKCESLVNKAKKGDFSASEVSNLNMKRLKIWFSKEEEDTYTVRPELKKYIDFSVFDLVDEQLSSPPTSIFGDFDLVFCANILFYYKPDYQKIIIKKASNCLANSAYLVVGEAERDILAKNKFKEVFPQSGIFKK